MYILNCTIDNRLRDRDWKRAHACTQLEMSIRVAAHAFGGIFSNAIDLGYVLGFLRSIETAEVKTSKCITIVKVNYMPLYLLRLLKKNC